MDTLTTDDKTNIVTAIDNYARIRKELKKLEARMLKQNMYSIEL